LYKISLYLCFRRRANTSDG